MQIVVAGGDYARFSGKLSTVEIFSLKRMEWRQGTPLPKMIALGATVQLGENGFLLIGGTNETTKSHDVYEFSGDEWTKVGELNHARASHVAVALSDTDGISSRRVRKKNPNTEGINIRSWEKPIKRGGF